MLSGTQRTLWESTLRAIRKTDHYLLQEVTTEEMIGLLKSGAAFRLKAVDKKESKTIRLTVTFFGNAESDARTLMDYATIIFGEGAWSRSAIENKPSTVTYQK